MDRSERNGFRPARFLPCGEGLEERQLLSEIGSWPRYIPHRELFALLHNPVANPAVRPNTPVIPFGFTPAASGFIDPTAHIVNGYAVLVASPSFIAPYTNLDAHGGLIKIGISSVILDNASIVANPSHPHTAPAPEVLIGNQVVIGYGAQVLGPSTGGPITIGSYAPGAPASGIGPGAVIDGANVAAGAYVGALAFVGPGITIPAGRLVLPGQVVTTAADLTNPAKVVTIQGNALATQLVNELNQLRVTNLTLALGYIALYQGQSATGASPGVDPTQTSIFSGNLAAVEGAGAQPAAGTPTATTAPDGGPTFVSHRQNVIGPVQGLLYGFRARVTGRVAFGTRANVAAHSLGKRNSIRADQGQPSIAGQIAAQTINIRSIAATGTGVTISAPLSGTGAAFSIGENFRAGSGAVIIGGPGRAFGNNVTIGAGAVVDGSSLPTGSTVGEGAYVLNSNFTSPVNIPAHTFWNNGRLVGPIR